MFNHNSVQIHTTKPTNPIVGDTYYETKNNRIYTYDGNNWIIYQLYHDPKDKNISRMKKIRSLLK